VAHSEPLIAITNFRENRPFWDSSYFTASTHAPTVSTTLSGQTPGAETPGFTHKFGPGTRIWAVIYEFS